MNNSIIKEAYVKYGSDNFFDVELISLILGEKVANSLKNSKLITLYDMDIATDSELMELEGIKKNTIIKIRAILDLVKNGRNKYSKEKVSSPKDIFALCKDMKYLDVEVMRLICLDTKHKVIVNKDIFKGTLDSAIINPREIFKEALKCSASKILVVHNHPSGDPTPSKEDINVTLRLKECGSIMGIEFIDHLIVGQDKYISLKEKGII